MRKSKNKQLVRKLVTQCRVNICSLNLNDMKNTFVKTDFKIQGFQADRIIFDDSDLVSMDVTCRMNGQLLATTFMFTFSNFNDLLRFSGESGDKLQLTVSDKLMSDGEKPYIIDLQQEPIVFTTCSLDLCYLIADDTTCFSVEDVMPISLVQQAKNLRINMADFSNVHLSSDSSLNIALNEVATLYRYYEGLKELNLTDEHAREKAGLKNEKLFKIAFYAAKNVK
jgi:hypothetical protein